MALRPVTMQMVAGWVKQWVESLYLRRRGSQTLDGSLTVTGNATVTGDLAVTGSSSGISYTDLDDVPSTFTPSSHTHDDRYFTETELSSDGGGGAVHYNNVTDKPSTFPPSSHSHDVADLPIEVAYHANDPNQANNALAYWYSTFGNTITGGNADVVHDGGLEVGDISARALDVDEPTGRVSVDYFRGKVQNVNDDAVWDITVPTGINGGILLLYTANYAAGNGLVSWRSGTTPYCSVIAAGADVNTSTSVLTGTTGADNKVTVSATGGHIYVENRSGSSQTIRLVVMI